MAWVGRDLKDHPIPTPCHWQGCHPPGEAAQGPIQPGCDCLQGWGSLSLSAVSPPRCSSNEKFSPDI